MPRTKQLPDGWRGKVLAARGRGMSQAKAAEYAGVAEGTIKYHRQNDPDFAEDWDAASETMRDVLRDELWRRAFDEQDPNNSWKALQWLAEHLLPEGRWKAQLEVSGEGGGPIKVQAGVATLGEVWNFLAAQGALDEAAAGAVAAGAQAELESGAPDRGALPGTQEVLAESR